MQDDINVIMNGYISEYLSNIDQKLKEGKVLIGYEINDDGSLTLTNERVFTEYGITDAEIEETYNYLKDCYEYAKAVEKFNIAYNNAFALQKAQVEASLNSNGKFDIMLVLIDTQLLYDELKDNEIVLKNKKNYKLLTDKIKPRTYFIDMVNVIELAFKNYKKFDDKTQKQLLALIMLTVNDAEKF